MKILLFIISIFLLPWLSFADMPSYWLQASDGYPRPKWEDYDVPSFEYIEITKLPKEIFLHLELDKKENIDDLEECLKMWNVSNKLPVAKIDLNNDKIDELLIIDPRGSGSGGAQKYIYQKNAENQYKLLFDGYGYLVFEKQINGYRNIFQYNRIGMSEQGFMIFAFNATNKKYEIIRSEWHKYDINPQYGDSFTCDVQHGLGEITRKTLLFNHLDTIIRDVVNNDDNDKLWVDNIKFDDNGFYYDENGIFFSICLAEKNIGISASIEAGSFWCEIPVSSVYFPNQVLLVTGNPNAAKICEQIAKRITSPYHNTVAKVYTRLHFFANQRSLTIKKDTSPLLNGYVYNIDGFVNIFIADTPLDQADEVYLGKNVIMYICAIYNENIDYKAQEELRTLLGGNFCLIITNQSMIKGDAPTLTIEIDGELLKKEKIQSDRDFIQHTLYRYSMFLNKGKHKLKVNGGGIGLETEFIIDEENDVGLLWFVRPPWYKFWKNTRYNFETSKGLIVWQ